VLTCGLGWYATLGSQPSATEIVLRGIVCGLGFGFFQSPNNRELMESASREKSPSASGLLAALRVGGQTLGTALVAIAFGVVGTTAAAGGAPREVVAHAAPALLRLACACAAVATLASGLRLRARPA
jgi:DHA2 family multidrug resistance protein-like MFS transporter